MSTPITLIIIFSHVYYLYPSVTLIPLIFVSIFFFAFWKFDDRAQKVAISLFLFLPF